MEENNIAQGLTQNFMEVLDWLSYLKPVNYHVDIVLFCSQAQMESTKGTHPNSERQWERKSQEWRGSTMGENVVKPLSSSRYVHVVS